MIEVTAAVGGYAPVMDWASLAAAVFFVLGSVVLLISGGW